MFRKMIITACAVCVLASIGGFIQPARAADTTDMEKVAVQGAKLTDDEAAALEDTLKTSPNDLESRVRLLGYYQFKQYVSPDARAAKQRHSLWIIENRPGSDAAGVPYVQLVPGSDGQAYVEAKNLWLVHFQTYPNDTTILRNAAKFFMVFDGALAERFLKQAQVLEPQEPEWPTQLGVLYSLGISRKSAGERQNAGAKALEEYEKAFSLTYDERGKFNLLGRLAGMAFEAGNDEKAKDYADRILRVAVKYKDNGNAIHMGNTVLGRLAVKSAMEPGLKSEEKSADIDSAKTYLLASAKVAGSRELASFGPNTTLAKDLLDIYEKDAVLQYFDLCGKFWLSGKADLQKWTDDVKNDNIPDFGAHPDFYY